MADIQEIDVKILPDGKVQLSLRGFKGPHCRQTTAELERLLGGDVILREHTADYTEASTESTDAPPLEQQDRL
jgi:hypothetical protein